MAYLLLSEKTYVDLTELSPRTLGRINNQNRDEQKVGDHETRFTIDPVCAVAGSIMAHVNRAGACLREGGCALQIQSGQQIFSRWAL